MDSSFMIWDPNPIFFTVPWVHWPVRWYGLSWALAFFFANMIMGKFFKAENRPMSRLDPLTYYMLITSLAGARLGHCFFYEPEKYFAHPLDILKVYEGGLASHGGVVGILIGLVLYCRKYKEDFLWLTDRIMVTVPLAFTFIRIGNFMNSEIIGKVTDVPWAIVFSQIDQKPRHPSQLYEAIAYLIIFFITYFMWNKKRKVLGKGFIFGFAIFSIPLIRSLIEFLKENQTPFENGLPLNMGQLLSIPFIVFGIVLMKRSSSVKKTST